jgi:5-methylcytosine-specific restriction enzyme A
MTRTTPEWIGRSNDSAPPARVKERVLRAHGIRCALTGRDFAPGDVIEFDHIVAISIDGENSESNLQPVLGLAHK